MKNPIPLTNHESETASGRENLRQWAIQQRGYAHHRRLRRKWLTCLILALILAAFFSAIAHADPVTAPGVVTIADPAITPAMYLTFLLVATLMGIVLVILWRQLKNTQLFTDKTTERETRNKNETNN